MWHVYLIQCGNRSYVGCTTDVRRRLRQHNREIQGGARSTASGAPNWRLRMYLSGFNGRAEAMRWEKLIKSRARGASNRAWAMLGVRWGVCPPGKGKRKYIVPSGLDIEIFQWEMEYTYE